MKKILTLCILTTLLITNLIGCSTSKIDFTIEDLENELTEIGYEYKRQDIDDGIFTPTTQYIMLNDNITIDGKQYILYDTDIRVYSYDNNENMEQEASMLSEDGSEIDREGQAIIIDWPKKPHFYKKGNIIVEYIGEDEKVVSDLVSIMGEQFAGIE